MFEIKTARQRANGQRDPSNCIVVQVSSGRLVLVHDIEDMRQRSIFAAIFALNVAQTLAIPLRSHMSNATFVAAAGGLPCDIFQAGGTPCVAAHSIVRALYSAYNGPLYLVQRSQDSQTHEIGVLEPGGFANAADQDSFCGASECTIQRIFDQSPSGNHLDTAPGGGAVHTPDKGVTANKHQLSAGGHTVYGTCLLKAV